MKIVVTGANSSVGKHLLRHLAVESGFSILACVRSDRAAASLPSAANIQTKVIAYDDDTGLAEIMRDADTVILLAGILFETRFTNYRQANVETTEQVVTAAVSAGAGHLIFISVVGADSTSSNPYYRSKGEAEKVVNQASIKATVIRTPILMGPDIAGGGALLGLASRPKARVLGGGRYTMQPLDVDDLCRAIIAISQSPPPPANYYELVGPEPVTYRALIERMATRMGKSVVVSSLPVGLVKAGAWLRSHLRGGGITPAVIDVITSNENVVQNADQILGVRLTALDETLDKIITQRRNNQ